MQFSFHGNFAIKGCICLSTRYNVRTIRMYPPLQKVPLRYISTAQIPIKVCIQKPSYSAQAQTFSLDKRTNSTKKHITS